MGQFLCRKHEGWSLLGLELDASQLERHQPVLRCQHQLLRWQDHQGLRQGLQQRDRAEGAADLLRGQVVSARNRQAGRGDSHRERKVQPPVDDQVLRRDRHLVRERCQQISGTGSLVSHFVLRGDLPSYSDLIHSMLWLIISFFK